MESSALPSGRSVWCLGTGCLLHDLDSVHTLICGGQMILRGGYCVSLVFEGRR